MRITRSCREAFADCVDHILRGQDEGIRSDHVITTIQRSDSAVRGTNFEVSLFHKWRVIRYSEVYGIIDEILYHMDHEDGRKQNVQLKTQSTGASRPAIER